MYAVFRKTLGNERANRVFDRSVNLAACDEVGQTWRL